MKWIVLLSAIFLSACGTIRSTQVIEYRQVTLEPLVSTVVVEDVEPVDVTVTEYQYY